MKYLPFENIIYITNLDSEEIKNRLSESIEPQKTFRMKGFWGSDDHKAYEGSLNGESFGITRIIGYRNSFLPRIKGIIERDLGKTKIKVKMRLHPFVMVFLCIWCGGVSLGFIGLLTSSMEDGTFEPMMLMPLGMLLFAYGLATGGFKFESIKSKKHLAELFEAEMHQ